jgi:hypothetical protein
MSGRYRMGQIPVQEVNSARRHAEARTSARTVGAGSSASASIRSACNFLLCPAAYSILRARSVWYKAGKIPGQKSRTGEIQPSGQLLRRCWTIFLQCSFQNLFICVHFGFLPLSNLPADGSAKIG